MSSRTAWLQALILVVGLTNTHTCNAGESAAFGSARSFVQSFYDWYMPLIIRDERESTVDVALRQRPRLFTPQLAKALREDARRQAAVSGYTVGIDFDPFLNTQDPEGRYVAEQVVPGEGYTDVRVQAVAQKTDYEHPEVTARIVHTDAGWKFANFLYPGDGGDLLSTLKMLKEDWASRGGR